MGLRKWAGPMFYSCVKRVSFRSWVSEVYGEIFGWGFGCILAMGIAPGLVSVEFQSLRTEYIYLLETHTMRNLPTFRSR